MKASTVGTHLHVVRAKKTVQTQRNVGSEIPASIGENGKIAAAQAEEQSLIRRGVRAAQRWPQERNARVEQLRSLVKSGRYQIDSKAIAECLLNDETHFV